MFFSGNCRRFCPIKHRACFFLRIIILPAVPTPTLEMARIVFLVSLIMFMLVLSTIACPWDSSHDHTNNGAGHDDQNAERNCYRALNQSCFIDCDASASNLFIDAPNTACTNPSTLSHVYYMQYTINITKVCLLFFSALPTTTTKKST